MTVYLHNPTSSAHLEDLRDRLYSALACAPRLTGTASEDPAQVEALVEVVRAMDRGTISTGAALDAFTRHRVPGFSFGRWIVEMVDEGVYLEDLYNAAA